MSDFTRQLQTLPESGRAALDAVMPLVYDELQATARRHLRRERGDHTLSTSALVNETYLRLLEQRQSAWHNRGHFFAVAAMVMRRVLVNYARDRKRDKRGGDALQVTLSEAHAVAKDLPTVDYELIDQAMTRLAVLDARAAQIVECRYFGGLSITETAEALNVAPVTVKRSWQMAKTWLRRELQDVG